MRDDATRFDYFNTRPEIFKRETLPMEDAATVAESKGAKAKKVVEDSIENYTDVNDVPLSLVEGIDKKVIKLLKKGKVITIGDALLPDVGKAEDVADLAKIKGIGESTTNSIFEAIDAVVESFDTEE